MKTNKKAAAALLTAVIALTASCGDPTVISNSLEDNGVKTPHTTTAASVTSETSHFETTAEESESTGNDDSQDGGDSGMVPDPLNEKKHITMSDKLDELGAVSFGEIETLNTLVAAIGTENGDTCDIYVFRGNSSELLFSLPRSEALTDVDIYVEDGNEFLIIYGKGVVGRGYPATVITIKDDEPLVLSKSDDENGELPALYYLPEAYLVCVRGAGATIGNNSVIPYHWNGGAFVPYKLQRISVSELEELDTDNVVVNAYGAVSIYCRENGLIHVNYLEMSEIQSSGTATASKTYVYEDGKLRDYNAETDLHYGFFDEALPVTDNTVSGDADGTGNLPFEIQG